jgi:hypothetical protein
MLSKEIIVVYCENTSEPINILYVKKTLLKIIKEVDTRTIGTTVFKGLMVSDYCYGVVSYKASHALPPFVIYCESPSNCLSVLSVRM